MRNRKDSKRSFTLAGVLIGAWALFGWVIRPIELRSDVSGMKQMSDSRLYHSAAGGNTPAVPDVPECSQCHSRYPHKKTPFERAFLNLHLGKLDCATCHLGPDEAKQARLGWYILTPDGYQVSPKEKRGAVLRPFLERGGRRVVLDSRTAGGYSNISRSRKHETPLVKPSCRNCHSSEGIMRFEDAEYARREMARSSELEHIMSAVEGKAFYYLTF